MKEDFIGGARIIDATKPLEIHVLPEDVKKGHTKDPGCCAVAQACMREFHAAEARVHLSRVYVKVKGVWIRYQTPPSMRSEIIAFDRTKRKNYVVAGIRQSGANR